MPRLLIGLGLVLAFAAPASAGTPAGRAAIRSFLLRSPVVSARVKATIRDPYDHAGIDVLLHRDLTADGMPEDIVTVFSGGTAGDIAFYVLTDDGSGGLRFLKASNQEYKIGVKVVAGALQVTRPLYGATDPNCCPAHLEITTYRDEAGRLVSASRKRITTPG